MSLDLLDSALSLCVVNIKLTAFGSKVDEQIVWEVLSVCEAQRVKVPFHHLVSNLDVENLLASGVEVNLTELEDESQLLVSLGVYRQTIVEVPIVPAFRLVNLSVGKWPLVREVSFLA